MKKIVITEFMDAPAVALLKTRFDVVYDPALVDDAPRLRLAVVGHCRGAYVAWFPKSHSV